MEIIMDKITKLNLVRDWSMTAFETEEEVCLFFGISIEDLLNAFPDALIANYHKVFPPETGEEDDEDEPPWNDTWLDEQD